MKDLRKLVIKAFHMSEIEWGEHNDIKVDGRMTVSKEMLDGLTAEEEYIEKIDLQISRETMTGGRTQSWISYRSLQRCLAR